MATHVKKQVKKEKSRYNSFQNSAFMIRLAWQEKRKIVLAFVVLLAILEVATSLLGLFVAPIILGAIEEQRSLSEFIITILLFIIPLIMIRMGIAYLEANSQWGKIDLRLVITSMLIEKFTTTSYSNTLKEDVHKKRAQAEIAVQTNTSSTEAIWQTMTNIFKNGLGFIIYILILAVLDPLIIGVVLITTIVSFLITKHINEWGYRNRDEEAVYAKQMNYINHQANDAALAKDIRIFGMGNWLKDVYQSGFNLIRGFVIRREKVYVWADITDLVFVFLRNGLAYIYLINLVLNDGLSAASFLLYFTAVGGFTTWVIGILSEFMTLHKQSLELSTIREFLDYPETFLFEEGEPLIPIVDGRYELEIRNVTFAYEGAEASTLENINLKISAGEKLAIVGVNGAGKTTLVKLLCGFLDPTEGEVLLNGVNIKAYNRRDYYQLFSAVFQDFSIIAGSIAQNVAQSMVDIDMNRVEDCLRKAGIDRKIKELPAGYDSKLMKSVYDDAIELSGGQTQRLMLARALYKNGPILMLDEPTAALDPIAESEIYQAYNDLTKGKTAIFISHRLASTGFCDRIILLDGSQIAEVGTHKELMENNGMYAKMFDIQSKYYQDEVMEEGDSHE